MSNDTGKVPEASERYQRERERDSGRSRKRWSNRRGLRERLMMERKKFEKSDDQTEEARESDDRTDEVRESDDRTEAV